MLETPLSSIMIHMTLYSMIKAIAKDIPCNHGALKIAHVRLGI